MSPISGDRPEGPRRGAPSLWLGLALWVVLLLVWKVWRQAALGGEPLGLWRADQELAMAGPRAAMCVAMLALGLRWWSPAALGWNARGLGQAALWGGGALAAFLVGQRSAGPLMLVFEWPFDLAILGIVLVQGLYEELSFRGVLWCFLAALGGQRVALAGTTLAYVLAHLDTSPTAYEVGRNALTGLLFGQLRGASGSFVGIAAAHAAIDLAWWIVRPLAYAPSDGLRWAHLALLLGLVLVHAWRRRAPVALSAF